ncbi:hypothetical protein FQR65_LT02456 [Abscondita terminalis]|nr:hypothetical protein FQR65_LT02456 [Abscondita terminalis]
MNALFVVFLIAASAANASLIAGPAALVGPAGLTLKGPVTRTTLLGADGGSIDSIDDAGAVSASSIVSAPLAAPAVIASPQLITSRAIVNGPALINGGLVAGVPAGLVAPWGRSLLW